ncbi:E3 ubiquitin-protein ligase SDIR1 [Apostasia shenzhenica]|uniref:E3 ubiquitin-protein ligase SDIR1 n=1 Tax=Apostasia shenzhenica TaxID=1088818 RepID=A0A2I0AJF9_9ASPA|nr:E3 ubiquitin-protein ligase SDIR1 [Apostasia shenzhenica]
MDSWRPADCTHLRESSVLNMNGSAHTDGKSGSQAWEVKSPHLRSALEPENLTLGQTGVMKENGKNEVIICLEDENPFPFHARDRRRKTDKRLERKDKHFPDFPLVGSSLSNRSFSGFHDLAKSSKEDEDLSRPQHGDSTGKNGRKDKSIIQCDNLDNTAYLDVIGGVSSYEIQSSPLDDEYSLSEKNKGKMIIEDDNLDDVLEVKPQSQPSRFSSRLGEELINVTDDKPSSFGSYQNVCRRAAYDVKESTSNEFSGTDPRYINEVNTCNFPHWRDGIECGDSDRASVVHRSSRISENYHRSEPSHDSQASPDQASKRRHQNRKRRGKGKRKSNLFENYVGESTASLDQRLHYPNLHAETSIMRRNGNFCGTCLEAGNYSQEARWNSPPMQSIDFSDNSNARASQVESDERLARELQEQFYHEMSVFNDAERVDATIAWSLQKDEDAEAAAYIAKIGRPNARESRHSCNQPSSLFWNYSSHLTDRATAHLRRNSNYAEMFPQIAVFDELRRNFPNEMDLDTRLDILEQVEDILENSGMLESDDLDYYHDFNEHDYETLLALDDNIIRHNGASDTQINRLPLSAVEDNKNEETCSVCLEIPLVGETMRLLPCLHKFHKECIDTWLKRKPLCPVCKSNIA